MFFLMRKLSFIILLAAAIGVPYLYFQSTDGNIGQTLREWTARWKSSSADEVTPVALGGNATRATSPGTARDVTIEQIFHYNWTPEQVLQVWPIVTRIYDGEFAGLRVALVTGTQPTDLAGSLTFYFDQSNALRRITFLGTTGDPRPLVTHIVSRFRLKAEPTSEAGLYVARWNGEPKSVLRLTYPPVVQQRARHDKVEVMLELNRPAMHYGLSRDFQQVLKQDELSGRWSPF